MDAAETTTLVKQLVHEHGFERAGVTAAAPLPRAADLRRWLAAGRAGEMHYMERHLEQRCDPSRLLAGARSVVVAALGYAQRRPDAPPGRPGRVALYAWGEDYHDVVSGRLKALLLWMRETSPAR